MKLSSITNAYSIENINQAYFSSLKNREQNSQDKRVTYKSISFKVEENENSPNNNTEDNGDELREGLIISASLRKQIEAFHSNKDSQENSEKVLASSYNINGAYKQSNI